MDAVLAARFGISNNNLMIKTSMFALGGDRQVSISLVRIWPNFFVVERYAYEHQ